MGNFVGHVATSVELLAATRAQLDAGIPRDQAPGAADPSWPAEEEKLLLALNDALDRGELELLRRYDTAYRAMRAQLTGEPAVSPLAASREASPVDQPPPAAPTPQPERPTPARAPADPRETAWLPPGLTSPRRRMTADLSSASPSATLPFKAGSAVRLPSPSSVAAKEGSGTGEVSREALGPALPFAGKAQLTAGGDAPLPAPVIRPAVPAAAVGRDAETLFLRPEASVPAYPSSPSRPPHPPAGAPAEPASSPRRAKASGTAPVGEGRSEAPPQPAGASIPGAPRTMFLRPGTPPSAAESVPFVKGSAPEVRIAEARSPSAADPARGMTQPPARSKGPAVPFVAPGPAMPLESYAHVHAELTRDQDPERTFARLGIEPVQWMSAVRHYAAAFDAEPALKARFDALVERTLNHGR